MTKTLTNKKKGITPGVIEYDARSFIINGKRELLIGGEFHYFRTPRELWEDRIVKMKRSGSNLVTTYIAWNWHEQVEGQQDWTGDRDLPHFIELCTKHDMFVVVKPGPYICAEWDFGGHPDWLLSKKIPLRVLNDDYLKYVDKWYKSVAGIIKPYLVTNGGNVIAIQVENEYDHLMEFGEEKITEEDAIEYFTRLKAMMDKYGIDIPKFANEAKFLRGSGIIDTRTYYPSIPWFWRWELQNYDNNIEQAKPGQPDCPTMILELQSGWFTMFGQPPFEPPPLLTEAVTTSSLSGGASFLNLYMFVGGTTFPFWTCRGDIFDLYPPGTGTCTSFDFGGSPIREWGELMPGRYDWMRIFNLFAASFKDLILGSDLCDDVKALAGGEDVCVIEKNTAGADIKLESPSERFGVLTNRLDDQYLVCVRNMAADDKVVDLGWADSGKALLKNVELKSRESFILPVGVKIPDSEVVVEKSSSSLLFAQKVNGSVVFGLFGKKGRKGEMQLNVQSADIKVLSGDVKVTGKRKATLRYVHDGLHVLKVGNDILVILDQDLAAKVDVFDDGVLVADTYFVRELRRGKQGLNIKAQVRPGSVNRYWVISEKGVRTATAGNEALKASSAPQKHLSRFSHRGPDESACSFKWLSDWKVKGDIAEAAPGYNDKKWKKLKKPISLEEAGLLDHGYIWYRAEFDIPEGAKGLSMCVPGNDTDRMIIYVNGQQTWFGITEKREGSAAEFGIDDHVKPGRNVVAVLYENFYHNKSHPHEGDILKYSGIMAPVTIEGRTGRRKFKAAIEQFKVREHLGGMLKGYTEHDFKDAKWLELPPSAKYVMDKDIGDVLWMRRKFRYTCKRGWEAGVKLTIPDAKDRCFMFLNGRPLGQFEHIGPQYDFYVPESYLQKDNTLTILLEGSKSFMDVCRGYLLEPAFSTFYEVKNTPVKVELT
jgi:hypothetical protein